MQCKLINAVHLHCFFCLLCVCGSVLLSKAKSEHVLIIDQSPGSRAAQIKPRVKKVGEFRWMIFLLQPLIIQYRAWECGKMVRMVRNSGGLEISEICGIFILQCINLTCVIFSSNPFTACVQLHLRLILQLDFSESKDKGILQPPDTSALLSHWRRSDRRLIEAWRL